jgi:hypothetical protein
MISILIAGSELKEAVIGYRLAVIFLYHKNVVKLFVFALLFIILKNCKSI